MKFPAPQTTSFSHSTFHITTMSAEALLAFENFYYWFCIPTYNIYINTITPEPHDGSLLYHRHNPQQIFQKFAYLCKKSPHGDVREPLKPQINIQQPSMLSVLFPLLNPIASLTPFSGNPLVFNVISCRVIYNLVFIFIVVGWLAKL